MQDARSFFIYMCCLEGYIFAKRFCKRHIVIGRNPQKVFLFR